MKVPFTLIAIIVGAAIVIIWIQDASIRKTLVNGAAHGQ
jgi:hypothetical protein